MCCVFCNECCLFITVHCDLLAFLGHFTNRCDIPVILMGESGCGKTRLVQYMCNLAAQSTETTNMKILKVCSLSLQSVHVHHHWAHIFLNTPNTQGPWWYDWRWHCALCQRGRGIGKTQHWTWFGHCSLLWWSQHYRSHRAYQRDHVWWKDEGKSNLYKCKVHCSLQSI